MRQYGKPVFWSRLSVHKPRGRRGHPSHHVHQYLRQRTTRDGGRDRCVHPYRQLPGTGQGRNAAARSPTGRHGGGDPLPPRMSVPGTGTAFASSVSAAPPRCPTVGWPSCPRTATCSSGRVLGKNRHIVCRAISKTCLRSPTTGSCARLFRRLPREVTRLNSLSSCPGTVWRSNAW